MSEVNSVTSNTSNTSAPSFELDDDFNIEALAAKLKASGVDKWLNATMAGALVGRSEQSIKKMMEDGKYKLANGTEVSLTVKPAENGKKAKISAKSLIEWYRADRRKAGSGLKGISRTTKNMLVTIPKDTFDDIVLYLTNHNCTMRDPSALAKAYSEKRKVAKNSTTPAEPVQQETITLPAAV